MHIHFKTRFFPGLLLLPMIILLEGFASIAAEILTIRQLLPVAGGSVIVTSLVIGFFLLFLALGYRAGGRVTNRLQQRLRNNFLISSVWLGVGLSYFFIFLFFTVVQKISGSNVIYPLILYLLLIISPLIYILGQTVPISMNMTRSDRSVGMIGGDTLGLSTIGSFLGATITALLLMNFFGVAWTICVVCVLLLLLSIALAETAFSSLLLLSAAMPIVGLIYALNISVEKNEFHLTNNYANYQIMNGEDIQLKSGDKLLRINNSYSSMINSEKKGFAYIEAIKKILFDEIKLKNADILILGAGGFTLSAEHNFDNRFIYVDIDRQIQNVVVPRFLNKINGELIADDARHFIHSTSKQFAAIVVDTYSNSKSIPAHLLTHEFFSELKRRLIHNGTIVFNIIAKANLADPYSKRIDNTIRSTFKNCMVMPLSHGDVETNILYTCRNTANQMDAKIYTDDLNTSTMDSFEWS